VLGAGYPVWAVAAPDAGLASVADAVGRANAAGATIVVTGPPGAEIVGAHMAIPVPEAPLPWLGPLLSIVPGQLFAGALARWRGLDPDAPLGLTKVTIVP
jgi:glucosamine--fructose-6-phosphate aminotransferase (isomerizing)